MRRSLIIAVVVLVAFAGKAYAGSNIQSSGKFGAGIQLGYPDEGLSFNYFLSDKMSLQVNPLVKIKENRFGLGSRVDALYWMPKIAGWGFGDLVWYAGFGGNFFWVTVDTKDSSGNDDSKSFFAVGAEGVIGIGLQFKAVPIDLNLEAVPILSILGNGGVDIDFDWAGVLNARWYF